MMRRCLRLLAYVLVVGAAIYSVAMIHQEQERDCRSEQRLRNDLIFVLEGAGENERAQLAVIGRLATQQERAALAKTFEPGLAAAMERIGRDLKC
jgi:hypothetical protein